MMIAVLTAVSEGRNILSTFPIIVVDQFGATEGLITIEDIVEELVGEILMGDEDDPIETIDDTEVVVRGDVNIDEVNEKLDNFLLN